MSLRTWIELGGALALLLAAVTWRYRRWRRATEAYWAQSFTGRQQIRAELRRQAWRQVAGSRTDRRTRRQAAHEMPRRR